jgi:secondary thiamine-phosphate synthase enzyme
MPAKKETTANNLSATVYARWLEFPLQEELDITNITAEVAQAVNESGLVDGTATVFVPGATGAVTCLEYEPGVIADFKKTIERLVPRDISYKHNHFQADGNGHSHVRAGLLGPSLSVPFVRGQLTLGVWQQVVLVNFDNRRRTCQVLVQVVGV